MGPLVGLGGVSLPAEYIHALERDLAQLCRAVGFPSHEPFKWSPGRDLWMRENLVGEARQSFFLDIATCLENAQAVALVAISDTTCRTATGAHTAEVDVTKMLLERIHLHLVRSGTHGVIIVDRPSGNRSDEEAFLLSCLEMLQEGAGFVIPDRVCINVLSSPAKFIHLIQAADLVVSCTLARVAGEYTHSPVIFERLRRLLFSDGGRIGGVGLKLHPDFKFANLYHWLVGDDMFWRLNVGVPLPLLDRPYARSADVYR